jgi:mannose/fructose-specific phosphotransferase system component IIA
MSPRVPALLVMHADLAAALLRAAERVYGAVDDVDTVSGEGLSRDGLVDAVCQRVSRWEHGGIVLTDFWGGSCHTSGATAVKGRGGVYIITGCNLPMLLDFLHNRDQHDPEALAERLQKKGQDSIRVQRSAT